MDVVIQIAQLILALTILVFIHELGHFMAARMFGIRVEKFFIFFDAYGKKLWSIKRGDTEYGIGWLPLGGYVKIAGMIDESMDKDAMKKPAEPWELRSKPNWQKFIVMIGGIVMNVILGIILYVFILANYSKNYTTVEGVNNAGGIYATEAGKKYGFETGDKLVSINGRSYERLDDYVSARLYFGSDVVVDRNGKQIELVVADSAFKDKMRGEVLFDLKATIKIEDFSDSLKNAKEAGLQKGDILKAIDSVPVEYFTQMSEMFKARKGQSVPITVDRNGTEQTMLTQVDEHGRIGILTNTKLYAYDSVHYSFGKALSYGTRDAFEVFYFQAVSLVRIFRGDIPARESISSPIGITKLFAPKWDWTSFWILTALLSMVLAFMNLLPIPALDGGHIMFIAIESITGRKLSDKFMERAQLVGMILLLSLMVFAVGNDIVKMFN
ncbi:MAG: RIP metalloprotease RseP [Chitinophagales bacterium]|jgi:regulator of sigma E protease|nr:RIP metalloprotease RseP [Bacteroidota bacterium]MBK9506747.1 RIP metalloprotease RseP [Bacteroidota bacterium]MBL0280019.1 RIP metalloprotease RseP [Bacteroidota bacterium]MBP9879869.1 RIP metalloprotease RseP [Chitinophagales bacterium]